MNEERGRKLIFLASLSLSLSSKKVDNTPTPVQFI